MLCVSMRIYLLFCTLFLLYIFAYYVRNKHNPGLNLFEKKIPVHSLFILGWLFINTLRVERVKYLTRFPFNFPHVEFMMVIHKYMPEKS